MGDDDADEELRRLILVQRDAVSVAAGRLAHARATVEHRADEHLDAYARLVALVEVARRAGVHLPYGVPLPAPLRPVEEAPRA